MDGEGKVQGSVRFPVPLNSSPYSPDIQDPPALECSTVVHVAPTDCF